MKFELDIIRFLQRGSNGFTDFLGEAVSLLGTEFLFLAVAVLLYWCIDKRYAHRFFNVYIIGVAVVNFMKFGFRRTRPYNFEGIKSIGDPEPTYSFPSGHSGSVSSIATLLTVKYGKKYIAIPIVGAIVTLLVMLSRMFLGQHYLSDVFCGLTVGVFCAIAFNALLSFFGDKEEWFAVVTVALSALIVGLFFGLGIEDSASGNDVLKGIGAAVAFDIGYFIEKRYVRYDVAKNRKWWKCLIRVVLGAGVAIAVQQGFKLFLPESIPMLYCFMRYFIMAIWAALACPAIFKGLKL